LEKTKRHNEEVDHMIQLCAVGKITAEYVGSSSGTVEASESTPLDDGEMSDGNDEPGDVDDSSGCIKGILEDDDDDDEDEQVH